MGTMSAVDGSAEAIEELPRDPATAYTAGLGERDRLDVQIVPVARQRVLSPFS